MADRGLDALQREGSVVNLGAAIGSQDDGGTVLAILDGDGGDRGGAGGLCPLPVR